MGWKLGVGGCTVVVVRTGFSFGEWGEKRERENTDIEKRGEEREEKRKQGKIRWQQGSREEEGGKMG